MVVVAHCGFKTQYFLNTKSNIFVVLKISKFSKLTKIPKCSGTCVALLRVGAVRRTDTRSSMHGRRNSEEPPGRTPYRVCPRHEAVANDTCSMNLA